jgi:hypothetical protein
MVVPALLCLACCTPLALAVGGGMLAILGSVVTSSLWLAAGLVLGTGVLVLVVIARRRARTPRPLPLPLVEETPAGIMRRGA